MTEDDKSLTTSRIKWASSLASATCSSSESAAGDPRRRKLDEIHNAATTALGLLARLFPGYTDRLQ